MTLDCNTELVKYKGHQLVMLLLVLKETDIILLNIQHHQPENQPQAPYTLYNWVIPHNFIKSLYLILLAGTFYRPIHVVIIHIGTYIPVYFLITV